MREQPPGYLKRIPSEVPPGRVIVHNNVRPTRRLNMRGFRAWYESIDRLPDLILCHCQWAPELGAHYIIKSYGTPAPRRD
jgi:hypothetical protein